MRPIDFYKWLTEHEQGGILTLSPGPFKIIVGVRDRIAAKVLLWMQDEWPELTIGETEEILLSALWWVQFWTSVKHCDDRE